MLEQPGLRFYNEAVEIYQDLRNLIDNTQEEFLAMGVSKDLSTTAHRTTAKWTLTCLSVLWQNVPMSMGKILLRALFPIAIGFYGPIVTVAATITMFTDRTSWEAEAGDTQTETFATAPLGQLPGGGVVTQIGSLTFSYPDVSSSALPAIIDGGQVDGTRELRGQVGIDPSTGQLMAESNVLGLPGLALSFGANFFSAASFAGLTMEAAGMLFDLGTEIGGDGTGFFGIVSDMPFDTVRFFATAPTDSVFNETYHIDNVSVEAVPEPSTVVLLGTSLLLGLLRSRRR